MSLTSPGDLYLGLNDSIFSKFLIVIQQQRPSLLNYASPHFLKNPQDCCVKIDPPKNGAPTFTELPPIQYLSPDKVPPVELMLQITGIRVGFGVDTVGLPPDMLPLPAQRIVIQIDFFARFAVPRLDPSSLACPTETQRLARASFPLDLCDCFSGPIDATATASIKFCSDSTWIMFGLDKFETPSLTPVGLRQTIDRLIVLVLDTAVLPPLWRKLSPFVLDLSKALPPTAPIKTITIKPTASSANPNPDINSDLLQARFNLEVTAP